MMIINNNAWPGQTCSTFPLRRSLWEDRPTQKVPLVRIPELRLSTFRRQALNKASIMEIWANNFAEEVQYAMWWNSQRRWQYESVTSSWWAISLHWRFQIMSVEAILKLDCIRTTLSPRGQTQCPSWPYWPGWQVSETSIRSPLSSMWSVSFWHGFCLR